MKSVTPPRAVSASLDRRLVIYGGMREASITAMWAAAHAAGVTLLLDDGQPPRTASATVRHAGRQVRADYEVRSSLPDDSEYVLLALGTRDSLVSFVRRHADALSGVPLIVGPSSVGLLGRISEAAGGKRGRPELGDIAGLPVIGDLHGEGCDIRAVKRNLPVSSFTAVTSDGGLASVLQSWLPDVQASTPQLTELSNTNSFAHPAIGLLNLATIADGRPFLFFREGMPDAARSILQAIEAERLAVGARLGIELQTLHEVLTRYYGDQGYAGASLFDGLRDFDALNASSGPATLSHRYFSEDLWSGVIPFCRVAELAGVPTPTLSSVGHLLAITSGSDHSEEAHHDAQTYLAYPTWMRT
jgi:NAD/NADP octopine/nopaline dehydrogenase-like protein